MTAVVPEVFEIKQHDLEPPLVSGISGSAGDLSTVSSWKVIAKHGVIPAWTDSAPTVAVGSPATSATITHNWATGQTDTPGTQRVEYEATWPGGRKQTFPADGYVIVHVLPDLG
jgi:hypothetical protein